MNGPVKKRVTNVLAVFALLASVAVIGYGIAEDPLKIAIIANR